MFRWNISRVSICVHCLSLHTTEMSLSSSLPFPPIRYLYTLRFPAQVFSPGGSVLALPASPIGKMLQSVLRTHHCSEASAHASLCMCVRWWYFCCMSLHVCTPAMFKWKVLKKQEVLPCSPHHQVLLYLHVPQWAPVKKKKEHNAEAELKYCCSKVKKNLTNQTEWKTQNITFSLSKGINIFFLKKFTAVRQEALSKIFSNWRS